MSIELLQKVITRQAKEAVHLQYLKYLYNTVEHNFEKDNIANHYFISFQNNIELEIGLAILASKLAFNNKVAIKLYEVKNQLMVETN